MTEIWDDKITITLKNVTTLTDYQLYVDGLIQVLKMRDPSMGGAPQEEYFVLDLLQAMTNIQCRGDISKIV
jgi:hypothetical protein